MALSPPRELLSFSWALYLENIWELQIAVLELVEVGFPCCSHDLQGPRAQVRTGHVLK